jgi:hypothetical protein
MPRLLYRGYAARHGVCVVRSKELCSLDFNNQDQTRMEELLMWIPVPGKKLGSKSKTLELS